MGSFLPLSPPHLPFPLPPQLLLLLPHRPADGTPSTASMVSLLLLHPLLLLHLLPQLIRNVKRRHGSDRRVPRGHIRNAVRRLLTNPLLLLSSLHPTLLVSHTKFESCNRVV